jgi:hypothetical protein
MDIDAGLLKQSLIRKRTGMLPVTVVTHCLYATARPKKMRNRVADGGPTRKYRRLRMQWTANSRTKMWNNPMLGSCTVN